MGSYLQQENQDCGNTKASTSADAVYYDPVETEWLFTNVFAPAEEDIYQLCFGNETIPVKNDTDPNNNGTDPDPDPESGENPEEEEEDGSDLDPCKDKININDPEDPCYDGPEIPSDGEEGGEEGGEDEEEDSTFDKTSGIT